MKRICVDCGRTHHARGSDRCRACIAALPVGRTPREALLDEAYAIAPRDLAAQLGVSVSHATLLVQRHHGIRYRTLRRQYGMPADAIATALDVTPAAVRDWWYTGLLPCINHGGMRLTDPFVLYDALCAGLVDLVGDHPTGEWVDNIAEARAHLAATTYTAAELAALLGVAPRHTSPSHPFYAGRPYARVKGGNGRITRYDRAEVDAWLAARPDARASPPAHLVARRTLAAALGVTPDAIGWHERHGAFPASVRIRRRAYYDRAQVIAWLNTHPDRWTTAARRLLLD